nr:MAG TPA: hypothetical protein [Caudoviricetes sp.]
MDFTVVLFVIFVACFNVGFAHCHLENLISLVKMHKLITVIYIMFVHKFHKNLLTINVIYVII